MNEVLMAIDASVLRDARVAILDPNWVRVVTKSECQRMKKPVVSLGYPFADLIVRQMTIVANCDVVVAGMLP